MSRLAEELLQACIAFGIKVCMNREIQIGDGKILQALAYLPEFGGRNGMLIFDSYAQIKSVTREIQSAGYGYAVLDEPIPDDQFDLNDYRDVFRDWGWAEHEGSRRP